MSQDSTIEEECCSSVGSTSSRQLHPATPGRCPGSGSRGKRVDGATVKAMLALSLREIRDVPYLFCRDADCPVVYFSADGEQVFTTDQLRERVYQKSRCDDQVFVCYCFRHTQASIRAELTATNRSTVVEGINAGIAAGQCACDIRNPQGACCLGNVSALVKELQQEGTPHSGS